MILQGAFFGHFMMVPRHSYGVVGVQVMANGVVSFRNGGYGTFKQLPLPHVNELFGCDFIHLMSK